MMDKIKVSFFVFTLAFIFYNLNSAQPLEKVYSKNFLLGKFNSAQHPDFSRINNKYTDKKDIYLQRDAYLSFIRMYEAAKAEGVKLRIVSATRSFYSQKAIWESKWNGQRLVEGIDLSTINDPVIRAQKILLYSSMPGTSRHHWGTDIDINNLNDSYFLSGTGAKVYSWLIKNASDYGFYQVYTPKPPRTWGYEEEKWHWTYLPLSKEILKQYQSKISLDDIKGFQGYDTVFDLDIIKKYVLGIDESLLP